DRFTVREQLQQPADSDRRDHGTARAGSEERPPTDPGTGRAAAAVFLPKLREKMFLARGGGVHALFLSSQAVEGITWLLLTSRGGITAPYRTPRSTHHGPCWRS